MILEICLAVVVFVIIALSWSSRSKKLFSHPLNNEDFDYDVAVVGSGIAGSAMAAVLARGGRKVVVIEKNLGMPERFIGELMQPRGLIALKELGLSECMEDLEAQKCIGYVIHDCREGKISLDFPEGIVGQTITNGRLVMNLRKIAMAEKNVTFVEGKATDLIENDNIVTGVKYKPIDSEEEQTIKAKLTIVADGCFSTLRKRVTNEKPQHLSYFVALTKSVSETKHNQIEAIVNGTCLTLFYQISDNSGRIIIDFKGEVVPKDMRSYLKDSIYPKLPDSYKESFLEAVESSKIQMMPNQYLPQRKYKGSKTGVITLGDSFNMRHPITAGGMTAGLLDVIILRKLLSEIEDMADYEMISKAVKEFFSLRRSYSFVINALSIVFHEVLTASDEWLLYLQKGVFRYLKLGGMFASGIVEMLNAIRSNICQFFFHFILILFYTIYLSFVDHFPFSLHKALYETIHIIGRFLKLAVPVIWSEVKDIFY